MYLRHLTACKQNGVDLTVCDIETQGFSAHLPLCGLTSLFHLYDQSVKSVINHAGTGYTSFVMYHFLLQTIPCNF
jgi:hypothetical protein